MRRLAAAAALALVAAPSFAQSISPAQSADSTIHRHLGFFFRVDLGAGYMNSAITVGTTDISRSGAAGALGIAVGGAVMENFIVGLKLWGNAEPDLNSHSGAAMYLIGVGPELTYYFMPVNLYVSAAAGFSRLGFSNVLSDVTLKDGFGARVAVGKEWWLSDHFGLGVAGQFSLGVNADHKYDQLHWITPAFALALSATYN